MEGGGLESLGGECSFWDRGAGRDGGEEPTSSVNSFVALKPGRVRPNSKSNSRSSQRTRKRVSHHTLACAWGVNFVSFLKVSNVSCKPGYETWRSLPLLPPLFIPASSRRLLWEPHLTIPAEFQEAVSGYKTKAELYLSKLEEAEIAGVKSARAESLGWSKSYRDFGGLLTLLNSPARSCRRMEGTRRGCVGSQSARGTLEVI